MNKINKSTIVNIIIVLLIVGGAIASMDYRNRAEELCEQNGMKYYSIINSNFYNWKGDTICYLTIPVQLSDGTQVTQMIFVYYPREG